MLNRFFQTVKGLYTLPSVQMENTTVQKPESDNESPECYGITEEEHQVTISTPESTTTTSTVTLALETKENTEIELVENNLEKKNTQNDPYAGYLAPNGRNKRRRTKKNRVSQETIGSIVPSSTVEYNGVVVSYSEDTIPHDMRKYVHLFSFLSIMKKYLLTLFFLYRYYNQRYSYFSRFDQGILMDRGTVKAKKTYQEKIHY